MFENIIFKIFLNDEGKEWDKSRIEYRTNSQLYKEKIEIWGVKCVIIAINIFNG